MSVWLRWLLGALAAAAVLAVVLRDALGQSHAPPSDCGDVLSLAATRHARRHKRHSVLVQLDQLSTRLEQPRYFEDALRQLHPEDLRKLETKELLAGEELVAEARCLVKPSDQQAVQQVLFAKPSMLILKHNKMPHGRLQVAARLHSLRKALRNISRDLQRERRFIATSKHLPSQGTAVKDQSVSSTHGRRLRGWKGLKGRESGSSQGGEAQAHEVRVTRGLGVFSGADFPCAERDAHLGAVWAQGACLIRCQEHPASATSPNCIRAMEVCQQHEECSTVDINVEGLVATLKRETELSSRTSRVKQVSLSRNLGDSAAGQAR